MFLKTSWFTSLVPRTQSCKWPCVSPEDSLPPASLSCVLSHVPTPNFPVHCNQGYLSQPRSDQVTLLFNTLHWLPCSLRIRPTRNVSGYTSPFIIWLLLPFLSLYLLSPHCQAAQWDWIIFISLLLPVDFLLCISAAWNSCFCPPEFHYSSGCFLSLSRQHVHWDSALFLSLGQP